MRIFSALRKSASDLVTKKFWYIIVAVILLVGFLIFRSATMVLVLIALTILSKLVETFLPRSVNFDLSLFTLVVLQQAYGFPTAFTVAVAAYLIGTFVKGKFTHHVAGENLVFPPIGFLVAGLIFSVLNFDIFTAGIITTVMYAVLMTILYGLAYRFPIFDMTIFLVTILPFNYFIFLNFTNPVLQLLA